jgi:hypothetical protein
MTFKIFFASFTLIFTSKYPFSHKVEQRNLRFNYKNGIATWKPEMRRALSNGAEGQSSGPDRRPVQLSLGRSGKEWLLCRLKMAVRTACPGMAGAAKLHAESVSAAGIQYLFQQPLPLTLRLTDCAVTLECPCLLFGPTCPYNIVSKTYSIGVLVNSYVHSVLSI